MTDSCLLCKEPVVFGKNYVVVNGKKSLEKFELDGKTPHVCKPKQTSKFPPRKPQESFKFTRSIKISDTVIEHYEISRYGSIGELVADKTMKELREKVDELARA